MFDYLIVGGGPAGSLLGLLLARQKKSVLILEAHHKIPRKVCGEYLCPAGLELLKSLNLGFDFMKEFSPINGMNLYSSTGIKVETSFPNGAQGVALPRDKFDSLMLDLAQKNGVQVEMGKRVVKFSRNENGFKAITTDGNNYESKELVGADGRLSIVSRYFKMNKKGVDKYEKVALHQNYRPIKMFERKGEMYLFEDGSYIGVDPVGFDVNISLVVDKSRLQKKSAFSLFEEYLLKSHNLLSRIHFDKEIGVSTAYPIRHELKSIQNDRVYLVGDAAGFFDPLTGEGIYYALLSSSILANLIERGDHKKYESTYTKYLRSKKVLNRVFQWLIQFPALCDLFANFLNRSERRRDLFIGVIGNVISPWYFLYDCLNFRRPH